MSVYTVHEPPLRAADALTEPERFVFVRDGFYWGAFLLTPLWMLWRRLWLVLVLYLVLSAGLETMLRMLGAPAAAITLVAILISLLIGLEAATLRRFTLTRRHWRNVGVISGENLEAAERHFFDAWVRRAPARAAPPTKPEMPAYAPPFRSESSGVIGLFPEPGARS